MKITTLCIILLGAGVTGYAESLPDWYIPFRDAIYEQKLTVNEILPLYWEAKRQAEATLEGGVLYTMLSRCEYLMGRAYQDNERKDEAGACYDRGIEWAEKSLETGDSAEGWQILAANISQNCVVKSASWALGNGLKVERYSKNTLKLDSRNASAKYMIAARWVFAPAPFHNLKRGIQMMEDILKEHETVMQKDDLFNVYSAIGYAYLRQKNNSQAKPWLEKSLEIFPTNKFAGNLLKNAN